jgi:hypothetical protein
MEEMSDAEGTQIRGQGFAFGSSTALSFLNIGGPTASSNQARALGFNHADTEAGAKSEAELHVIVAGPNGPTLSIQVKAAVGSVGYTKANSN